MYPLLKRVSIFHCHLCFQEAKSPETTGGFWNPKSMEFQVSPSNSISAKTGVRLLGGSCQDGWTRGYRRLYPRLQAIKFGHLEGDPQPECLGDKNQTWVFNHLRVLGFDSLEISHSLKQPWKLKVWPLDIFSYLWRVIPKVSSGWPLARWVLGLFFYNYHLTPLGGSSQDGWIRG